MPLPAISTLLLAYCAWVSARMTTHLKFVNMISCEPLVVISLNLQLTTQVQLEQKMN